MALRSVMVFAVLLAACGAPKPESVAKCASDADCGAGEACNVRGFCQTRSGCRDDSECAAAETCETATGACRCTSDAACAAGQFCTASGRCQDVAACADNTDCPSGTFCDVPSKRCLMQGTCTSDTQCALGQICDAAQMRCAAGCRVPGDCPQTRVDASGLTVFSPMGCVGGQCRAGGCNTAQECTFGQACTASACVSACTAAAPYCRTCDRRTGCAGTNNFCLVDPRNGANCDGMNPPPSCKFFCGVDCAAGQTCPSGYSCYPIVVVGNRASCACNTQCAGGAGLCLCNEGATQGFCPCRPNSNDCGTGLTCEGGLCLLGKNCFPAKGLYCDAPGPACP